MKKVLVAGAGGFIGGHLVKYLKSLGYWVRGADQKFPEYRNITEDDFLKVDLSIQENCSKACSGIDEVYQLAADMGGMGFISKEHIASLHNSNLINTYMAKACAEQKVERLFFSSSVCVYPMTKQADLNSIPIKEEEVFPAYPNEAYGWEKLTAEIRYLAYMEQKKFQVRIARFENTYGPFGTYDGGREKAPAALCRKVALAKDGGEMEMWGDGLAQRHFTYVGDLVVGIYNLMQSPINLPLNLGSDKTVSIRELAETVIRVSGKKLSIKSVPGPQGARSRVIDHSLCKSMLEWEPGTSLEDGIRITYDWIKERYKNSGQTS